MEPWIQTYTGKEMWFLEPAPDTIDIIDIAHSLSLKCRYNGHCRQFYSVAEHAILACDLLKNEEPEVQMWGLLHESGEPYISDIPAPVKQYIPGFIEIENRILLSVAIKFKLSFPMPKKIKEIDLALLHAESLEMMVTPSRPWDLPVPPADVIFHYWDPFVAKEEFLSRFNNLVSNMVL